MAAFLQLLVHSPCNITLHSFVIRVVAAETISDGLEYQVHTVQAARYIPECFHHDILNQKPTLLLIFRVLSIETIFSRGLPNRVSVTDNH